MVSTEECLFCKIVRNEVPSKKIYEDENVVAFLDINPAAEGHALVIPRKHAENVFTISEEDLANVCSVTKEIASRIKSRMNASGVNILQNNGRSAGQIVDHYHAHIVPRYDDDSVMIKFPRNVAAAEHLETTARKLSGEAPEEKKQQPKEPEKIPEKKPEKGTRDLDLELEL